MCSLLTLYALGDRMGFAKVVKGANVVSLIFYEFLSYLLVRILSPSYHCLLKIVVMRFEHRDGDGSFSEGFMKRLDFHYARYTVVFR